MPLYVRDDDVLALAVELQRLTNAPSKTEAVRQALRHEIERTRQALPLRNRLARSQALAEAIGPGDPDFDMKSYTDALWDRGVMFIDASAIVAILKPEPDAESLIDALEAHGGPFYVSPLVRFEASISLARAKSVARPTATILAQAREAVTCFINDIGAVEIPISPMIGAAALDAATAYGKTVGHPADLNFGDCFAYACAKTGGLRLLYKGQDFTQTDLA